MNHLGDSILWAWKLAERRDPAKAARGRRVARKAGTPIGFVEHRDPGGGFRVRHPSSWVRVEGDPFHVQSPALGTFIRVEPAPAGDAWAAPVGPHLTVDGREEGRAWGRLELPRWRYTWEGIHRGAWRLLLGNVLPGGRSVSVEAYEDRVLKIARESFRVYSSSG
jgi:hypothetical protein